MKLVKSPACYSSLQFFGQATLGLALIGCQPQLSIPEDSVATDAKSNATVAKDSIQTVGALDVVQVDFAGFEDRIQKFAGKLVVVDVWSTGCPPCMKEYPNLVALSQRWPEQVACISYNVDYIGMKTKPVESYLPKVSGFLDQKKSTTVLNLISNEPDSDVFEKLKIASIPVVLLFDRQGKLMKKFTESDGGDDGLTYTSDIIPAIEAALK